MSNLTPDLVKNVDAERFRIVVDNEKTLIDGNEYSVEHIYLSGLKIAEISFNKSRVRGTFVFSDKPNVTIGEDIIVVNKGLSIDNVKVNEEVISDDAVLMELCSKPVVLRVTCEADECTLYLNDKRSYVGEKIYISVRNENNFSVINMLLNPVKITWIYLSESKIKVKVDEKQIFVELLG